MDASVTVIVPPAATAVTAPAPDGQVEVTFGAAAITTLAGNVSVKLMPDCAGLPAPLVSVKVSVEIPPEMMTLGANALLSEACTTVSVWLVTPLVRTPPTLTLAAPFTYAPAAADVTFTLTVHELAPAAAFTPLPPMVNVAAPAAAVTVGAPPQPFTTPGTAAITTPAGRLSLNVSPERAGDPAGLEIVKVSVLARPTPTVAGANALVSAGRLCTLRPDGVTAFVTRAVALILTAAFVYGPPTTPEVTSTVITQEACAALIDAPVMVMVPQPAAAATAPAPDGHVVVTFGAAATTTLAGNVSVKLIPDCAGLPAPLASVNVSVETPPETMTLGAKALLSEACTTVSVWLVTPLVRTPPTLTLPAPFVYAPVAADVTLTLTVHELAPAAAFTPAPPIENVPAPAA